jgi:hypothetical protein
VGAALPDQLWGRRSVHWKRKGVLRMFMNMRGPSHRGFMVDLIIHFLSSADRSGICGRCGPTRPIIGTSFSLPSFGYQIDVTCITSQGTFHMCSALNAQLLVTGGEYGSSPHCGSGGGFIQGNLPPNASSGPVKHVGMCAAPC